jgi:hypothetical protein
VPDLFIYFLSLIHRSGSDLSLFFFLGLVRSLIGVFPKCERQNEQRFGPLQLGLSEEASLRETSAQRISQRGQQLERTLSR